MKTICGRCGKTIQEGTGISFQVCADCQRAQILNGADHQGFHDGQRGRRNEVVFRCYDEETKAVYDESFKAGVEDKKHWTEIKDPAQKGI